MLFLDLDRFKKLINGTYGRLGGSQVLVQVERAAARAACASASCWVRGGPAWPRRGGPLGGDASGMMVSPAGSREDVSPIAQAVLDALSDPFLVDEAEVYVSASLGIAIAPADGTTSEELLQRAELAMADAGRRGGGAFRFYSRGLSDARQRSLKIDRLLRRTLERNELSSTTSRSSTAQPPHRRRRGPAALAVAGAGQRASHGVHPGRGRDGLHGGDRPLGPADRVPPARAWDDLRLPPIRMATNVSLCQITRGNLPQLVEEVLSETGVEPRGWSWSCPSAARSAPTPRSWRQLQALRRRGVRVSVDDFGTGDSAIAYPKRFPLDTLKVDQSFIAGALSDPDDAAITSAMIAMAHRLRLRVVAEGVERQQQVDMLNQLECEEIQGFFFSAAGTGPTRSATCSPRTRSRLAPARPSGRSLGNNGVSR